MINLALLGYGKMGKTIAALAPQRGFEVRLAMDIDVNAQGQGITPRNSRASMCASTSPLLTRWSRTFAAWRHWASILWWAQPVGRPAGGSAEDHRQRGRWDGSRSELFYRRATLLSPGARRGGDLCALRDVRPLPHRGSSQVQEGRSLRARRSKSNGRFSRVRRPRDSRGQRACGLYSRHARVGLRLRSGYNCLRHTARGRQGLAEGALHAARWVVGKKGLFSFADVLKPGEVSPQWRIYEPGHSWLRNGAGDAVQERRHAGP